MRKYIEKFHYLTQDVPNRSHVEQVQMACEAGIKWIQYRCLTKGDAELIEEINHVATTCDDWGATLILTDHLQLLDKVDAQGVHVEDMNADFIGIREQIGPDKTLGASANSFTDILRIAESGVVDYIGCGPFSITTTKPNSYPLLGLEGYQSVVEQMRKSGVEIPIIAVGGIQIKDVEPILKTGVYGIAISGAVNLAENPRDEIQQFYNKIY